MPTKAAGRPETRGRPTLYKGIRMRSRLEADFASTLGRHGETWEYEPDCFAADGVQWLPDFRLTWTSSEGEFFSYVEVKPATLLYAAPTMTDLIELVDKLLLQMSVAWESEPDAVLQLSFHTYGQRFSEFDVLGAPGRPWICVDNLAPNPLPLTWPGMGQEDALPSAPESARMRRAASAR